MISRHRNVAARPALLGVQKGYKVMTDRVLTEGEFWDEINTSLSGAKVILEPYCMSYDHKTASYETTYAGEVGFFIAVATVMGVTTSGIKYRVCSPVADTTHTTLGELGDVGQVLGELEPQFDEFNYVRLPDGLTIDDDDVDLLDTYSNDVMTDKAWSTMIKMAKDVVPGRLGVFNDEDWVKAIFNDDSHEREVMFNSWSRRFNDIPVVQFLLEYGSLEDKKVCLVDVICYADEDVLDEAQRAYRAIKDGYDIEEYDAELAESEGYELVNTCKKLGFDFQELYVEAGH